MKNKEFLNICYKYLNRFIVADELIEGLKNMDRKSFLDAEQRDIDDLINEIKKKSKSILNKEDDLVAHEKKKIEKLMKMFEDVPENMDDTEVEALLKTQYVNLREKYNKEMDSHERWLAIADCITNNKLFNKYFDSLSDYELLEFIAQYINAPFPPELNQDDFEKLVKAGAEKDEREWLWRLAFNYGGRNINFDSITNYFIKVKDGYYLAELISAVGEYLNIDGLIDKVNDKDLIEDLKERKDVIKSYFTDEQFVKLVDKIG